MRPHWSVTGLLALTASQFVGLLAAHADDDLWDQRSGAFELEVEAVFTPFDFGDAFDELDPLMLFGARASLNVGSGFALGAGVRSSLSDPEADHLEVSGSIAWTSIEEPRLDLPPAVWFGARLEVGWRWLELVGSDFVVNDSGLVTAALFESGVVLMRRFAVILHIGAAGVVTTNGSLEKFPIEARFGLGVRASF